MLAPRDRATVSSQACEAATSVLERVAAAGDGVVTRDMLHGWDDDLLTVHPKLKLRETWDKKGADAWRTAYGCVRVLEDKMENWAVIYHPGRLCCGSAKLTADDLSKYVTRLNPKTLKDTYGPMAQFGFTLTIQACGASQAPAPTAWQRAVRGVFQDPSDAHGFRGAANVYVNEARKLPPCAPICPDDCDD